MPRRYRHDHDALELLLDTVCNAFGGIIFIVLLLVILPQHDTTDAQDEKTASTAQMARVEDLRSTVSRYEHLRDMLESIIEGFPLPEGFEQAVERVENLREQVRELQEMLASHDLSDEELDAQLTSTRQEIQRLAGIRDRLWGLLEEEAEPPRIIRLPRLHSVRKSNYFLIVSHGRVYYTVDVGHGGLRVFENEDDLVVRTQSGGRMFRPRPNRGNPVDQWLSAPDGARRLMAHLPRHRYVVNICIYPDSLEHFEAVRNVFTSAGYQYNWHPLTDDTPLVLINSTDPATAQ
jgi:hypothetical protein